MPIDPNIAMGYRPPQIESPDVQNARAAQLAHAQQQNMLGQMQMMELARANQQKNTMRDILSKAPEGAPTSEINRLIEKSLITGGDIAGLMAHRKALAEAEAAQANVLKAKAQTGLAEQQTAASRFELDKKRLDHGYESIGKSSNPAEYKLNVQDALNKKLITQEQADIGLAKLEQVELQDRMTGGNTNFKKFRMESLEKLLSAKDELARTEPKYVFEDIGGKKVRIQTNPNALDFDPKLLELVKTMSPADEATDKYHQGLLANARRRLNEELATGAPLTPQTLDYAAQIYKQTGVMPQVGMGKNAQSIRSAILTRAAQLSMGNGATAEQAASDLVSNKIDVGTRTKASKDFSTGPQGKQVTAFNTAIDHLATMDKLSDALQNGDVKLINSLGNVVARQTGQPAPTNFDAAKQIVTAEVIKAVVASGGGVTERQEAERNFAAANSPVQLKGLVQTYKKLLGGQLNSLGVQYENTTGKKDFESKLTPDAKAEFKAVRTQTAPAPSNPNLDALLNKYK
jgi:hypothetical protein